MCLLSLIWCAFCLNCGASKTWHCNNSFTKAVKLSQLVCAERNTSCVTMCSSMVHIFLLVPFSAGELVGLHWGAGTSWTTGPAASAQTLHEAAADTAEQGAADCPVQLHMRAPENSSGLRHHTECRNSAAGGSSLVSSCNDNNINTSARLRLFSTFSLAWFLPLFLYEKVLGAGIWCCSQPMSYLNIYMNVFGPLAS